MLDVGLEAGEVVIAVFKVREGEAPVIGGEMHVVTVVANRGKVLDQLAPNPVARGQVNYGEKMKRGYRSILFQKR